MVPAIENLISFDQWCVSFINDHRDYFHEDTAEAAIYCLRAKLVFGEIEMNWMQFERFKFIAEHLYLQGFWAQAGILKDIKTDNE